MDQTVNIFKSVSDDADAINDLFSIFFILAAIAFILISSSVLFLTIKFKNKNKEKVFIRKEISRNFERFTFVIAFALVIVFFFLTLTTMRKIQPSSYEDVEPDIIITGHQWWWEIYYPKQDVYTANELHIPFGEPLIVRLESADVVHDWFVPAMGRKMDMIPGVKNHMKIQAREPGRYFGACNEYCGAQHTWMRIEVVADTLEDFEKWIEHQQKTASNIQLTEKAKQGEQLFMTKVCASCHAIKGTLAVSRVGPDLTHLGSRRLLLAGKIENNYDNLHSWIKNPQAIKPECKMPNFILSDDQVDALTAYLNELK